MEWPCPCPVPACRGRVQISYPCRLGRVRGATAPSSARDGPTVSSPEVPLVYSARRCRRSRASSCRSATSASIVRAEPSCGVGADDAHACREDVGRDARGAGALPLGQAAHCSEPGAANAASREDGNDEIAIGVLPIVVGRPAARYGRRRSGATDRGSPASSSSSPGRRTCRACRRGGLRAAGSVDSGRRTPRPEVTRKVTHPSPRSREPRFVTCALGEHAARRSRPRCWRTRDRARRSLPRISPPPSA